MPLEAAEINDLNVNMNYNKIIVSASLLLDKEQIESIRNGGSKEIIFNFDLFRGRVYSGEDLYTDPAMRSCEKGIHSPVALRGQAKGETLYKLQGFD
jgi:hypothetical protein